MRLKVEVVEALMKERPAGTTLEDALGVFEVFASGTLSDEVYILDDVSGKRIAIAPAALRDRDRGGQWLLREIPHVLRVRITERFEPRVRNWVRRTAELTGETPNQRAATEFVRRDDNDRAGRMKYLYEVDISDPALYDVTLNAEKVSLDAAVQLIEGLVRRPEFHTTDTAREIVASRTLASRVQVALATHPETRKHRITVEATEGVVTLEGATGALDHAVGVARSVPGVRAVRTRQVEIPPIPPFVA